MKIIGPGPTMHSILKMLPAYHLTPSGAVTAMVLLMEVNTAYEGNSGIWEDSGSILP